MFDGTIHLQPLNTFAILAPIHMISPVMSGSIGFYDPWVVPSSSYIEAYGAEMHLSLVDISYELIHSSFSSTGSSTQPDVGIE